MVLLRATLPKDKILDYTNLKEYADDKRNQTQMMVLVFDSVKNTVKNTMWKIKTMLSTCIFSCYHIFFQNPSPSGSLEVGTML